ncbi:iron ABC transporter permease [Agrobacterium sp. AGB01]|uniref:FecCD family ABC transporter permease n=1 Tax=Agrobacterium sp. AGB01 TaxID=2769302 RepID=UPI00177C7616|nr:iron ABC transporter permease [Agrobacterium sp. AGB01]MBD9390590.1 iron ABC transporter permease [Agrobacterium sp. AGB01]
MNNSGSASASLTQRKNSLIALQRAVAARRLVVLGCLFALTLLLLFADIVTGPSGLPFRDVVSGLWDSTSLDRIDSVILYDVRLPASLMALLVGVALSTAGVEMQTVLDNPLASPFTLGVSSAAALGAAVAIVLGSSFTLVSGGWFVSSSAFVFAIGSVALLQLLTTLRGGGNDGLVLFGIALVFSFNAALSLLQFYASAQSVQQVVFWMMGNLQRAEWAGITILAVVVVVLLPLSWMSSPQLTALHLGEERAMSFGVDVKRLRFFSLVRVSLLTATAVAFVGTIGFIGLVGPHIARMIIGEDHRYLIPASALSGAILLLGASIAAKMLVPNANLPVGIVAALVGVPVFIALIVRQGKST